MWKFGDTVVNINHEWLGRNMGNQRKVNIRKGWKMNLENLESLESLEKEIMVNISGLVQSPPTGLPAPTTNQQQVEVAPKSAQEKFRKKIDVFGPKTLILAFFDHFMAKVFGTFPSRGKGGTGAPLLRENNAK